MKILYAAMKYNYGKPEQGYSFEHFNFYESLANMGYDLLYFDYMTIMREQGRAGMNTHLRNIVRAEQPDLLFMVLFTEEFDPEVIREISEGRQTQTVNWFCDDHWRFENYSRRWAPMFNWVVTTASNAVAKYQKIGYRNVIHEQWACNHFSYRKLDLPMQFDVTFVGQPHGERRELIKTLRRAGIDVKVWGDGWESGRLSQKEMIRVFNQSRINLNLSNSSITGWRYRLFPWTKPNDQIKGRNFEIPGCGGFQLSGYADNLGDYFEPEKEIICFETTKELIEKVRYYLANEQERLVVAAEGYKRALAEHTYEQRFQEIFLKMGLAESRVSGDACEANAQMV